MHVQICYFATQHVVIEVLSARQIAQNQKLSKTFFHKKACRNTYDEGRRWETDLALRI